MEILHDIFDVQTSRRFRVTKRKRNPTEVLKVNHKKNKIFIQKENEEIKTGVVG